jgi:ABC-type transport system substrate-binding protein
LQIEPKNLKNYASGFIVLFCTRSVQQPGLCRAGQTSQPDIRDSGFVYCVSGQVDTFNPQKAGSGLIVDTLAAQLYDRLLDVDPYTYRLVPELAESWEVLDNGATYRFHLRDDVAFQRTPWFTPTRKLNADDVVFTFQRIFNRNHPWHNVNGDHFPISTVCSLPTPLKACASWITERLNLR